MGLRFRKSLNLGGGIKVNFSKSGIGYSAGGKGFRVTKTAKGTTRTTAGIPGTGLSYVKEIRKGKSKNKGSYSSSKAVYDEFAVNDYSNYPAPKSSKYYNFRYYSLKFYPIPLMFLSAFYIIYGLLFGLVNEDGTTVSGLSVIPSGIVFAIGLFILFHIGRFIYFHLPKGYERSFRYYDKLLKFCTLASTAAKREREQYEENYSDTFDTAAESESGSSSESTQCSEFVADTSKSEYDNRIEFLERGGTLEQCDSLKAKNNWTFDISETDSYTNYLSAVRPVSNKYYSQVEKIQSDWSVLYNLKDYTGPLASKFEDDCYDNINSYIEMKTVYEKYKQTIPTNIPAFRRLAMLYEKQERFEEAVDICRKACSFGMDERSRMVRMIKKAGRTPTAEEEIIINQTI